VPAVATHKFLGMDAGPRTALEYAPATMPSRRAPNGVTMYCQLAKLSRGVSPKYMRWYFIAIAVPKMLYVANLFLILGSRMRQRYKGSHQQSR